MVLWTVKSTLVHKQVLGSVKLQKHNYSNTISKGYDPIGLWAALEEEQFGPMRNKQMAK